MRTLLPFLLLATLAALLAACGDRDVAEPPSSNGTTPSSSRAGTSPTASSASSPTANPAANPAHPGAGAPPAASGTGQPAFPRPDPADLRTTPSGLRYEALQEGTGKRPSGPNANVTVHYSGWLTDGTLFDSSYRRGQPISFPLGGVIRGWTEGLQLMREGATYVFVIPPELAYGDHPPGDLIPPGSTLVFQVHLISTN